MTFRLPTLVMTAGVNALANPGEGTHGWVSGTPALAADGASGTVLFDLGPNWAQYGLVQYVVQSTVATSLTGVVAYSSDTTTKTPARRLPNALATSPSTVYQTVTTAGGALGFYVRPMGRFLHIDYINTAAGGAQGSTSSVVVSMHAG